MGMGLEPAAAKVLLVEDDAATRSVIARHLRASGYDVTPMESAEDVILATGGGPGAWDVVISDVHLPGTSGLDLASYMLRRRPTQPIVLITGDPDEALARDALSRGPVSYLLKPFELFELEAAVRQAIGRAGEQRVERKGAEPGGAGEIPEEWLRFVDERSYAGAGHAERVAELAVVLAEELGEGGREVRPGDLKLAARVHELGRLRGPVADPTEMVMVGARMLEDAGFPPAVVQTVRHLHERWDGMGGPDSLAASRIPAASLVLAVADSLDHYSSAWRHAGLRPVDAADRAIGLVVVQQSTVFSPLVAAAAHRRRADIRKILTAGREEGVQAAGAGARDRVLRLA
jgi:response regulator RpfG family c-di-GMP phosphodiesterase